MVAGLTEPPIAWAMNFELTGSAVSMYRSVTTFSICFFRSVNSIPSVAGAKRSVTVRRCDLLPVDAESFIAVIMTDDSRVKSRLLRSDIPVTPGELPALANLLNTHFTGISAEEMGQKLMGLTTQLGAELFMPLSQVIEFAGEVMDENARSQVYTSGQTQI